MLRTMPFQSSSPRRLVARASQVRQPPPGRRRRSSRAGDPPPETSRSAARVGRSSGWSQPPRFSPSSAAASPPSIVPTAPATKSTSPAGERTTIRSEPWRTSACSRRSPWIAAWCSAAERWRRRHIVASPRIKPPSNRPIAPVITKVRISARVWSCSISAEIPASARSRRSSSASERAGRRPSAAAAVASRPSMPALSAVWEMWARAAVGATIRATWGSVQADSSARAVGRAFEAIWRCKSMSAGFGGPPTKAARVCSRKPPTMRESATISVLVSRSPSSRSAIERTRAPAPTTATAAMTATRQARLLALIQAPGSRHRAFAEDVLTRVITW